MNIFSKKKLKLYAIALSHGIWMTTLVFLWLKEPFILDYEFSVTKDIYDIEWVLRRGKIKGKEKYINKFLFVNTSQSLEIDSFAPYNKPNVRTNREHLYQYLQILNKNSKLYDVIVFDVFINEIITAQDSLLFQVIQELKEKEKIVTVNNIAENYFYEGKNKYYSRLEKNAFGDYLSGTMFYPRSLSDAYYKFNYQIKPNEGDLQKQIPLLAYECISRKQSTKPFFFDIFYSLNNDNNLYQNIYIPRNILTYHDIIIDSRNKKGLPINTSNLSWDYNDEESAVALLKEKPSPIIIIGDFMFGDIHYTTAGLTRGPLMVANAMIPLIEEGGNQIQFGFIFFLIVTFTIVSYLTFYGKWLEDIKLVHIENKYIRYILNFILDELNYIILILATLIGVFVFNHYIFLLFNTFYIFMLDKVIGWARNYKLSKL